ncbi:hypothetical protein [Chitinimonas koreensis]|uniref:hypothetical protein n=1 Tax=Chitinimonas koreensis TaxID=356302 RepID=UPI000400993F|nr:hypothetical protein [Chitinimonas koreensis]QNM97426.1 hypothetical protein H9L41_03715 [Chitinimonas koreensis]
MPLLLGLLLALAGCALPARQAPSAPTPVPTPTPTPPPDANLRELLERQDRLRQQGQAEIAREIARLGEAAGSPAANPAATLELAIALGQQRDAAAQARALNLLETLARSPAAEAQPYQPLARLLAGLLAALQADQRRIDELQDKQAQQLREYQRKFDQLNEKLEALKAIERSLPTRPAPATVKGTPP